MAVSPDDVTTTVVGVAGAGSAFWLIRWVIRTFHLDRNAIKAAEAEGGVMDRLISEISRLEKIIHEQQAELEAMRKSQRRLEARMSAQKAVILAIDSLVEGMCDCDNRARDKIGALVAELVTSEAAMLATENPPGEPPK